MTATYASFRQKLSSADFSLAIIPGSTTNDQSYNVYLQLENRTGTNLLSDPQYISVDEGEGLQVTINPSAIASGEEVFWIVLSLENTGNQQNAVRVAAWQARTDNQLIQNSLPITISLTTDEHFNTNRVVAITNDLPTSGILDGAIAFVVENGNYYRYDSRVVAQDDKSFSYNIEVEAIGNWIKYDRGFNSYLADTQGGEGADVQLSSIENALSIPPKIGASDSTELRLWINNGYQNDGQSPIINGNYSLTININGVDYSAVFSEKIQYYLRGYVDRNTGILNTAIATVGELKVWSPTATIKLPEDLPRNQAAVYDFILAGFDNSEIANLLPVNPILQIDLYSIGNNTGITSEIANYFGDLVFSDLGKLLIVPGATRLSGLASVKIAGSATGFIIDTTDIQPITGLLADTPDQIAAMAGSLNGLVVIRQQGDTLAYSEVIRAYISTETGLSNLSLTSATVAIANQRVSITITHPINNNGKGIVRSNYTDWLLAGNEQGIFTPTTGYLFLDIDGTIYQSQAIVIVPTQTQTLNYSDLIDFSAIASLPVQSDPAFSLFEPVAIDLTASGTGSINGEVTAYFGYSYDSPNTKATKIRHDLTGTIKTASLSIGEILSKLSLFDSHINDTNNPHDITRGQIGAASQEQVDKINAIAFPTPEIVSSLPKVLAVEDHGKSLIVSGLTGQITIPDNVTDFPEYYQVLISQKIAGDILIEREDGNQTDLYFTGEVQHFKSVGEVVIRREAGTNVFWITGALEA